MAGLNCGTPSLVAWPTLRDGLDAAVALDDDEAPGRCARRAPSGLAVGECSGAVVAAAASCWPAPSATAPRWLGLGREPVGAAVRDRRAPRLLRRPAPSRRRGAGAPERLAASAASPPPGLADDLPTARPAARDMRARAGLPGRDPRRERQLPHRLHDDDLADAQPADRGRAGGHGRLLVLAAETEVDSVRLRMPGAEVRSYVGLDPPSAGAAGRASSSHRTRRRCSRR